MVSVPCVVVIALDLFTNNCHLVHLVAPPAVTSLSTYADVHVDKSAGSSIVKGPWTANEASGPEQGVSSVTGRAWAAARLKVSINRGCHNGCPVLTWT